MLVQDGVEVKPNAAGMVSRLLAWMIDSLGALATQGAITTVAQVMQWLDQDLATAFTLIAYFVVQNGWFMVWEFVWDGSTPGKKIMGLRTVSLDGSPLTFAQIAMRNLLRLVDSLPALHLVGALCIVWNGRRLGDRAAGTLVQGVHQTQLPDFKMPATTSTQVLKQWPIACARLRRSCSGDLFRLGLEALQRRNRIEASQRLVIMSSLAQRLQQAAQFPEEVQHTLPDEAFVRECIALMANGQ